jgi:hypothetical protein
MSYIRSEFPDFKSKQCGINIKNVHPDEYYTLLPEIAIAYANKKRWYQAVAIIAKVS